MTVKIYVRALLYLYLSYLFSIPKVAAQELKVGDTLPPGLWGLPLPVVNHPEGKEMTTLGEYKDKLIILDFWATWCAPCIKSLSKLDSLQKQFENSLGVIPVTYEAPEKVLSFLKKRKFRLPSVVNNREMKEYFPHRIIPHQVWVKEGVVFAITDAGYSSADNVKNLLNHQQVKMITKAESRHFDPLSLLKLTPGILYESGLKSRENNSSGSYFSINKNGLVNTNSTAEGHFRTAFRNDYPFSNMQNRIIYELPDSTVGKFRSPEHPELRTFEEDSLHREWLKKYTYTYYNRYTEPQPRPELFRKMKEDITSFFQTMYGVEMRVEKRSVPCYVLKKTGEFLSGPKENNTTDYTYRLHDKPFRMFAKSLATQTSNQPFPVVDETGYSENVTMKLMASLEDIPALQKELLLYGLELVREVREIEMMVFKQVSSDKL